jgi:phenylacetate-CoA ligase
MARSRREKITLSTILRTLFVHKSRLSIILMDGGLYPAYSNVVHRPRLTSLFVNLQVLSLRSPIDELVGKLNAFQPDVLMGYPSIIMALAYEQIAGRMNILNGPEIHTVATLSEPLSEHARSVINRAFPCPLVNIYGSGECLTIAKSCLEGSNMHVNHDLVILEIVDREGRPVPPGQFGHKVYLTNLENYVQPFIRYEITDVTAWDDKTCNCGITLPLIKDVSSRTDDILYVRNPEGSYQIVHPYWIMVPLLHIHAIKEYQVIQSERNALDVSLVLHEGQSMDLSLVEQSLRDSLSSSKVAAEIALNVKSVAKITPDPKSGKIRRIHSAVGPPKDLDYLIE